MICPYTSCGQIPCIVYLVVISILLSDEFFAFTPTGNKIRHDLLCIYNIFIYLMDRLCLR